MRRYVKAILSTLGIALSLASCVRDLSLGEGHSISFKADTYYDNGPSTKTSYSGIQTGGKERIDWEEGDLVRILSDKATTLDSHNYADYKIHGVTHTGGSSSYASLGTTGSGGLRWGTGTHAFYCLYPSPSSNGDVSLGSGGGISFSIPSSQTYTVDGNTMCPDMQYAYMYSAVSAESGHEVSLPFKPMFSAFQFTIDSASDPELTLTELRLSSASKSMAGTVTATLDASSNSITYGTFPTSGTGVSKTVAVSFAGGLTITKGTPKKITIFALPQDYGDLTVSYTTTSGHAYSLALKDGGTWVTFTAGHKYNINNLNLPEDWSYTVDDIGDFILSGTQLAAGGNTNITVKSSRRRNYTGQEEKVPWTAYVSTDGGENFSTTFPTWLTLSKYSGEGSTTSGETVTVTVAPNDPSVDTTPVVLTAENDMATSGNGAGMLTTLRASSEIGSDTSPRDLSLYDIYGSAFVTGTNTVGSITKAGPHTSNCYVVSAPGYYCFPLVYGNAIDMTRGDSGTGVQAKAYKNGTFINALGNGITSPYILNDTGVSNVDAVVVWEDVPKGALILSNSDISVIDAPAGSALSCKYIKFHIPQDKICPGNIVIALRDTGNSNMILWSWHIWITTVHNSDPTDDFYISNVLYRTALNTNVPTESIDMLGCNLGWIPPIAFSRHSLPRNAVVKIVQDVTSANPTAVTFNVEQGFTTAPDQSGEYYSNPFFRWGRKDPIPGVRTGSLKNKNISEGEGYTIITGETTISTGNMNHKIDEWIKNPYLFETNSGVPRYDLWNTDNDNATNQYTQKVAKSIYDPCPAGFSVPLGYAFTGFTSNGRQQSGSTVNGEKMEADDTKMRYKGYLYSTDATTTGAHTLFFPAAAERDDSGKIGSYTDHAGYLTAVANGTNNSLIMYIETDSSPFTNPNYNWHYRYGFSVRPVLEQN